MSDHHRPPLDRVWGPGVETLRRTRSTAMALENKLGITESSELARMEEKLSKQRALELFETGALDRLEAGTFAALASIHRALFSDIYDLALYMFKGKISNLIHTYSSSTNFNDIIYKVFHFAITECLPDQIL